MTLLLGCIFREKLLFDGKKYRTTLLNEAAAHIFYITKNLRGNENGKDTPHAHLSRDMAAKIPISNGFVDDLQMVIEVLGREGGF
jgi:site-specific DNA recombinase